jgi:hypothetical protein
MPRLVPLASLFAVAAFTFACDRPAPPSERKEVHTDPSTPEERLEQLGERVEEKGKELADAGEKLGHQIEQGTEELGKKIEGIEKKGDDIGHQAVAKPKDSPPTGKGGGPAPRCDAGLCPEKKP